MLPVLRFRLASSRLVQSAAKSHGPARLPSLLSSPRAHDDAAGEVELVVSARQCLAVTHDFMRAGTLLADVAATTTGKPRSPVTMATACCQALLCMLCACASTGWREGVKP